MDITRLQNIGPRESLGRSPFRLQSDANISLRTAEEVAKKWLQVVSATGYARCLPRFG